MIPNVIPASQVPEPQSAAVSSGVPDKGFISILKSSVQNAGKTENDDKPAPVQETTSKNATHTKNTLDSTDSPVSTNKADAQQSLYPVELFQQLVMQMTAIAQQTITTPLVKDASTATSVVASEIAQVMQTPEALPLLPGKIVGTPATAQEDNNPGIFLKPLTENAPNVADVKGEIMKPLINPQQNNATNTVLGVGDSAKVETGADLKAFKLGGKDAASMSKASEAIDDGFSQWKIETSAGQASGDRNSSRDASGLYAQTLQTQPPSIHAGTASQEVVVVSKLTAVDEVISKAVDAGQKNLIIRIDPPDLGNVQIRLSFDNGVLKADVRVDSSAIKDSFDLALPQIRTSLENSGIKVSEFHVDVREDQYRNGQESNNQRQQQRQGRGLKNGFSDFFA